MRYNPRSFWIVFVRNSGRETSSWSLLSWRHCFQKAPFSDVFHLYWNTRFNILPVWRTFSPKSSVFVKFFWRDEDALFQDFFPLLDAHTLTPSHVITQLRLSDWFLVAVINLLGNSLKIIIFQLPQFSPFCNSDTLEKVSSFIFMSGLLVLLQTIWYCVCAFVILMNGKLIVSSKLTHSIMSGASFRPRFLSKTFWNSR